MPGRLAEGSGPARDANPDRLSGNCAENDFWAGKLNAGLALSECGVRQRCEFTKTESIGLVWEKLVSVEQQVAPDLILTVGFLGERGTHLRSLVYWENSLNPAYSGLGNTLYQPLQSNAGATAGVQTPFPNFFQVNNGQVGQALLPHPQFGYINNDSYLQNRGQSKYNARIVKLERKFRNGLNLLISYTWSKTFTDADSIQPYFQVVQSQGGTQNPYDLKAERAVNTADVPTNFVASYLYKLPIGRD